MDNKEEIEEMLRTNEKLFTGFLILRGLCYSKPKKNKVTKEDLDIVYENYCFLMSERKNILENEKRLKAINGFMGLR